MENLQCDAMACAAFIAVLFVRAITSPCGCAVPIGRRVALQGGGAMTPSTISSTEGASSSCQEWRQEKWQRRYELLQLTSMLELSSLQT